MGLGAAAGEAGAASHGPRYEATLRLGHLYVLSACLTAVVLAATNWETGSVHAAAPGLLASPPPPLVPPPLTLPPLPLLPPPLPPPPGAPAVAAVAEAASAVHGGALEHARTALGPVELVWEGPRAERPVGVLLLFHGCSHSAGDFWPPSPRCADCLGLPEERRIQEAALQAKLLTVAVSSEDRTRRCWRPATDGPRVAAALPPLLRRHGAEALPLFALGASSGGAFAAALPHFVPHLAAVNVQIMGADPQQLLQPLPAGHGAYPPSRWTHMPRDAQMAGFVDAALQGLRAAGLEAEEARVGPLPVTPVFLAQRVAGMAPETSAKVEAALRDAGLLDEEGFLLRDPRAGGGAEWRSALAPLQGLLGPDALRADASAVAEELNLAWAEHEITADDINATLAFFAKHAQPRPVPAVEGAEVVVEEEAADDEQGDDDDDEQPALLVEEDDDEMEALLDGDAEDF